MGADDCRQREESAMIESLATKSYKKSTLFESYVMG